MRPTHRSPPGTGCPPWKRPPNPALILEPGPGCRPERLQISGFPGCADDSSEMQPLHLPAGSGGLNPRGNHPVPFGKYGFVLRELGSGSSRAGFRLEFTTNLGKLSFCCGCFLGKLRLRPTRRAEEGCKLPGFWPTPQTAGKVRFPENGK